MPVLTDEVVQLHPVAGIPLIPRANLEGDHKVIGAIESREIRLPRFVRDSVLVRTGRVSRRVERNPKVIYRRPF